MNSSRLSASSCSNGLCFLQILGAHGLFRAALKASELLGLVCPRTFELRASDWPSLQAPATRSGSLLSGSLLLTAFERFGLARAFLFFFKERGKDLALTQRAVRAVEVFPVTAGVKDLFS